MGDEIPMRSLNFILILACVTSFAFAENTRLDKARFDAMFNTLDNPRTGLSDEKISSLKNPFGFKKEMIQAQIVSVLLVWDINS